MAVFEQNRIETQTGVTSEVLTIEEGNNIATVYSHGAINELISQGEFITAHKAFERMLVHFPFMNEQKGGNPVMGPSAGRYDSTKVSQPGEVDIHGFFAGMNWFVNDVTENSIEMKLTASYWKSELKEYYSDAAKNAKNDSVKMESLKRLMKVTQNRYNALVEVNEIVTNLDSAINDRHKDKSGQKIDDLVFKLIELAYPGDADITRRITIETTDFGTIFTDVSTIKNVSESETFLEAMGYHTYFNATLDDIVVPTDFWNGEIPPNYDDDLPDVRVRILRQTRYDRWVVIVPLHELQDGRCNQIIYKDYKTIGEADTAIEIWRQQGNADGYPNIGRAIPPGQSSQIGMQVIVVNGPEIPNEIQNYIDQVNQRLIQTES